MGRYLQLITNKRLILLVHKELLKIYKKITNNYCCEQYSQKPTTQKTELEK